MKINHLMVLQMVLAAGLVAACGDDDSGGSDASLRDDVGTAAQDAGTDDSGDQDGTGGCSTPAVVTYDGQIKDFLTSYCTRCHSSQLSGADRNGAPVGRNWDTYAGIEPFASLANSRIQAGTMPPTAPKPDACDRALFQAWVDQGAPEM